MVRYVIIGGGIAGVSCFEELKSAIVGSKLSGVQEQNSITLITTSPTIKSVSRMYIVCTVSAWYICQYVLCLRGTLAMQVTNVVHLTRTLESFDIEERAADAVLCDSHTSVVIGTVIKINTQHRVVCLQDGSELPYDRLCICTGAVPRLAVHHPRVVGLRDEEVRESSVLVTVFQYEASSNE